MRKEREFVCLNKVKNAYYCITGFALESKSQQIKKFLGTCYTSTQCLSLLSCASLKEMQGLRFLIFALSNYRIAKCHTKKKKKKKTN